MAKLLATRTASAVMSAEFVFNFDDTMLDTAGALKTFGSVYTDAGTFEVINLPVGAEITGGGITVETAGVGPTAYTAAVAANSVALLGATTLLTAGFTAFTLTGTTKPNLAADGGHNLRVTIASTVANATAGKVRVRVDYVLPSKADYTVPA
jgi:hypothetical protein